MCSFRTMRPKSCIRLSTGKSLSEALIFASTNPKYDNRLFIELPVQYMKIPNSEHGENMRRTCCAHKLFFAFILASRTIFVHNMYWTRNSMNNLLSYFGLVDATKCASDKDLPVQMQWGSLWLPSKVFSEPIQHYEKRETCIGPQSLKTALEWEDRISFYLLYSL